MTAWQRGAGGAVLAALLGLLCAWSKPGQALVHWSYDWSVRLRPDVPLHESPVVILYMDDASHRELDPKLTLPYRPYHTHKRRQPLRPGQVVELDVEIWPTSIVVPQGHRIALTVRGKDYQWQKSTGARLSNFKNELLGCGPFLHDDPRDRPRKVFGGKVTLHLGPKHPSYILLPIIPTA